LIIGEFGNDILSGFKEMWSRVGTIIVFVDRDGAEAKVGAEIDHGFTGLIEWVGKFGSHAVGEGEEENVDVGIGCKFGGVGCGETEFANQMPKCGHLVGDPFTGQRP
jgi:hypothetical protein